MNNFDQIINSTKYGTTPIESVGNESEEAKEPVEESKQAKETNITDPKVCHDPTFKSEGIARYYHGEGKTYMKDGELSAFNSYDTLLTDGVQYPLLTINNRNVEDSDIVTYKLSYREFLPTLSVLIIDEHQDEQKISSTQMSGMMRTCIVSSIDKVYKKIIMQFRITNVEIDHDNPTYVRYEGTYEIPKFRNANIGHIWMNYFCPAKWCMHQGKKNANTWEFLHELALRTGLGFAATYHTKEIEDRTLRNIPTQRINEYISNQIQYSGLDENSIMDAWVDLYGYIVLVNLSYVFREKLEPSDLTIIANAGFNTITNMLPGQKPQPVERTLTNWKEMPTQSNMVISSYSMNIDNDAVQSGTLERTYMIQLKGRKTVIDTNDIQIKQSSLDGDYLEDYNTDVSNPIPKFNFNCPEYTGMEGYDMNFQRKVRQAWFSKRRQSILKVQLKQINLGLQRGTLVNISIYDNDIRNKKIYEVQTSNIAGSKTTKEDNLKFVDGISKGSTLLEGGIWIENAKLSGLYYIDGMEFIYDHNYNEIIQMLYLIKKGITTGYNNNHTAPHLPEIPPEPTLPESEYSSVPSDLV